MAKIKEIEERLKAPRINKPAAKRFVKSALWRQAQKDAAKRDENSRMQFYCKCYLPLFYLSLAKW